MQSTKGDENNISTPTLEDIYTLLHSRIRFRLELDIQVGPKVQVLLSKSLYRSRAGRLFFGTENVIWAGLARL